VKRRLRDLLRLSADNGAKRPRHLPVAAALNLDYRIARNLLLGAVRDLDARVAAKQPSAAHDWRGRQREQDNSGDDPRQHKASVTGLKLSRKLTTGDKAHPSCETSSPLVAVATKSNDATGSLAR
jgi:hypothetical protein